MKNAITRKLTVIFTLTVVIMLALIGYFGVSGCVSINQRNYSYIKSVTEEEVTCLEAEFDDALTIIKSDALCKQRGLDFSDVADEYMIFDAETYIEADSFDAVAYENMDFIKLGMQGKSGIEIDFDKVLSDEVSLVFYAPVIDGDKVLGVYVGQFYQENMQEMLMTECYGEQATSFLTDAYGDIIFASEDVEDCIGLNLFEDYYAGQELVETSLDDIADEEMTFESLDNVMYNGADFGYTAEVNGEYEITYVASLYDDQFAIVKIFPPAVSTAMVYNQASIALAMAIILATVAICTGAPLVRRYNKYHEMEIASTQAEAANEAKSDFLSKMSHDMRTPLNGILGMADIALRNTGDAEKTEDCLRKIKSSGHYLLNLVNEVLDLHTIEAGGIELNEAVIYVPDMQAAEYTMVTNYSQSRDLVVNYENKLEHQYVIADIMVLQKIAMNLVSNAVKYTPDGGKINVSCWEEELTAENIKYSSDADKLAGMLADPMYRCFSFCVEDNGIGMKKEFMDKMFTPYEREEDVRTSKTQGTGLGLPIVKALAEMMGGYILVESELGKGSTFTVKIFLRVADDKQIAEAIASGLISGEGLSGGAGGNSSAEAHTIPKKKIGLDDIDCSGRRCLIVEDNELNLEIAKSLIMLTGMSVETAMNGQEALDILREKPDWYYDMIFMDIQMPIMDGYEATRNIRALHKYDAQTIPIVAMTANAYEKDVQRALDEGMNDHIAKPVEQERLAAVICKYLEVSPK